MGILRVEGHCSTSCYNSTQKISKSLKVKPWPNALDFSLYVSGQISSIVVCCLKRMAKHSQLFTRLETQDSTDILFQCIQLPLFNASLVESFVH